MIFVLEKTSEPTESKMRYVHRDAGGGFGYTRTYCWHLRVAKKWKTRRGVERWLDAHPGFRRDYTIVGVDE